MDLNLIYSFLFGFVAGSFFIVVFLSKVMKKELQREYREMKCREEHSRKINNLDETQRLLKKIKRAAEERFSIGCKESKDEE